MGSTSFLGFFCPNLLFCFSQLVIFLNLLHIFSRVVLGLFLGLHFSFFVPYFELACDHGNSIFFCLEE